MHKQNKTNTWTWTIRSTRIRFELELYFSMCKVKDRCFRVSSAFVRTWPNKRNIYLTFVVAVVARWISARPINIWYIQDRNLNPHSQKNWIIDVLSGYDSITLSWFCLIDPKLNAWTQQVVQLCLAPHKLFTHIINTPKQPNSDITSAQIDICSKLDYDFDCKTEFEEYMRIKWPEETKRICFHFLL